MRPPRTDEKMPTDVSSAMNDDEKKKANLRMALVLASIALVFFIGFVAKMVLMGR
jgi:hypothetical protein